VEFLDYPYGRHYVRLE